MDRKRSARRFKRKGLSRLLIRWLFRAGVLLLALGLCLFLRDMGWSLVIQSGYSAERIKRHASQDDVDGVAQAFADSLREYTLLHNVQSKLPSAKRWNVLRWTCKNYDGLGDRMRGLLHAFVLSVESGRFFELAASKQAGFHHIAYPGTILWNTTYTGYTRKIQAWNRWDAPELATNDKFLKTYGRHQALLLTSRNVVHYERLCRSEYFMLKCVGIKWPVYAQRERCWYDGKQNLGVLRLAHDALFRYRPHILDRVDTLMKNDGLTTNRYIVIHARVGYANERKLSRFRYYHGKQRDASIRKLLMCAVRGMGDEIDQIDSIYLASDDRGFRKRLAELVNEFPELTRLRIVESSVAAEHTAVRTAWNSAARKNLENAVSEAILMGRGRILVNTGSGLSVYAAITGKAQLLTPKHCDLMAKQ